MPGAVIKKGAKVRYAIIAEDVVVEEGATVGGDPAVVGSDNWGITVIGDNLTVGKNAEINLIHIGKNDSVNIVDRACDLIENSPSIFIDGKSLFVLIKPISNTPNRLDTLRIFRIFFNLFS